MRILRALLLSTVVIASASSAHALGGYAHWQNTDDVDSGFGFGLQHQFKIVPVFSAEARAAWIGFDGLNMYPLEAIGRAKLGLLYGGGGIGYYLFSGDEPRPKDSVGYMLLVGGEFTMLGLGAFAEARYQFLEPDLDIDGGEAVKMDGLGATLGVILPIG